MVTFKVTVISRLRSWPSSRSRQCLGDITLTVSVSVTVTITASATVTFALVTVIVTVIVTLMIIVTVTLMLTLTRTAQSRYSHVTLVSRHFTSTHSNVIFTVYFSFGVAQKVSICRMSYFYSLCRRTLCECRRSW